MFDELKAGLVPLVAAIAERVDAVDDSALTGDFPRRAAGAGRGHDPPRVRLPRRRVARRRDRASVRLQGRPARRAARPRTTATRTSRRSSPACTSSGTGSTSTRSTASLYRTPLGRGASLGVHESQSRMWENMVGRSLPFWEHFFPLVRDAFPAQVERPRRGGVLPRRQPRPALADPHPRRRDHLQPPHHPPLRARAGSRQRRARAGGRERGVGREDRGVPRDRRARRGRRRPPGHALVGRRDRLLPHLRARQRHLGAALGADAARAARSRRAGAERGLRRAARPGSPSTSTATAARTCRASSSSARSAAASTRSRSSRYLREKFGAIYGLNGA